MEQLKEVTGTVSEFFAGNPFASPVGAKIEQATDGSLVSEDWALNMEICDLINMTEDGPREGVRALKKRLQTQMGKNNTAVLYSLTVLETCVKNCDRRFHQLVASKEFVNELVRLIGPKYDPPQVVQEKVLSLIQSVVESWADAFRSQADLRGVGEVYAELKAKGVEFPPTDLDSLAPIVTPQRKFPPAAPSQATSGPWPAQPTPRAYVQPPPGVPQQPIYRPPQAYQAWHTGPAPAPQAAAQPAQPYSTQPSPEQLAKLRSELDIVNGNVGVLREMLSELVPGSESAEDLSLLQDLYATCRQMQHRITTLLQTVASEEVTSELLLVNDELNSVFGKFERYMKNREEAGGPSGVPAQLRPTPPAGEAAEASLIDLGDSTDNATAGIAALDVGATGGVDVSDVTLGAVIDSQRTENQTAADKERDLAEMEAWLKEKPVEGGDGTSKEFDDFLASRAEKKD